MRPVFITSSPNTQSDDVALAWWLLWRSAPLDAPATFAQSLRSYLKLGSNDGVYLLDSGRSSLYFLLSNLGLTVGDEVIVPAFTCLAVANPVQWSGLRPIYVDIEQSSFNMDLDKLPDHITPRTRAIVVQHTFGKPVDMERVRQIVGERRILIIEDCAHSLGGTYQGKKLGNHGDAAVLSFGIDKVISGVRGGALVVDFNKLASKGYTLSREALAQYYTELPDFPRRAVLMALLNPLVWSVATPTYFWGVGSYTVGRLLLRMLFKLRVIGNAVDTAENVGSKPALLPAKMAPTLVSLAQHQLAKIQALNAHRRRIAEIYAEVLHLPFDPTNQVYQKFSLLVRDTSKRRQIYQLAKRKLHIIIGDWLPRPLYAKFSSVAVYEVLSYQRALYPYAEDVAARIINLPTSVNITEEQARRLARLVYRLTRQ